MTRMTGRLGRFSAGIVAALSLINSGCTRSPYATPDGAPYGSAYPGSPWPAPAPGVVAPPTLPPPQGSPGGGALPSVPALPPAPGAAGAPYSGGNPVAPNSVGLPDWSNPGTMAQQQQRANVFDPYADNNVAPEIVGGRPRDFQKPLTDAGRPRGFRDTRWPF